MSTVDVRAFPLVTQAIQLAKNDQLEPAAQALIAHLRQHPDEPRGLAQLGHVAMRMGALGQAEHFLRKAISLGEVRHDVRRDLAAVLSQQERTDEAIAHYEALLRERDDADMRMVLSILLDKLGRHDEALAIQTAMAEAHPGNAPILVSWAHSLRAAGRVDEAIAAYRRATAADEEFGEAWWGLASIKARVFEQADIAAMRAALAIAVDVRNTAPLHFALARALHDMGNREEAFHHYSEANRLRAESLRYDARELTEEVAEVERTADRDFMAAMPSAPVGEVTPIFIISLPRSGSTLLEQMLGSHPAVEPVGELQYVPALLRSFMEMATRRGQITVTQAVAGLGAEQAASFGVEYLRRVALHRKTDRPFVIDKLPHNWSNVAFIRTILPQARFIDIRRPAMDCCFSNFTQSFTSAHASSFALEDVGQCYVDYVRLMKHLDSVTPGLIHHLDYSRLVEDPQPTLASALEYLGLPWDDAILQFHKLDRVVRTPSSEQVRRPLNRDGMAVWQPYSEWLDPLRAVLGGLAEG